MFSDKRSLIDHRQNESDLDEDIIHSVDSLRIVDRNNTNNSIDDALEYDDLDSLNVSMLNSPSKMRTTQTSKNHRKTLKGAQTPKSKDRRRGRNQIAFYSSLIGAAVVMFYLTKFYYSTHQANDSGNTAESEPPKANNPSIELRKK